MKKEIAIPVFVLATIATLVFFASHTSWFGSRFYERHDQKIEKASKVSEVAVLREEKLTLLVSKPFIGVEKLDEDQYSVQLIWENGNATTSLFQSEGFIAFGIPGHPLISPELFIVFRDGRQKTIPLEINY
ncbi:MAG: hypothetical protein U9M90_03545 [Patescibacteria group bacterium]|nr:hypothetical protein [Patescibacteria group bacterium]